MLPLAVVEEIRRLLDAGTLSQRKIAAKLGVGRGTVNDVASGKRGVYGREPGERACDLYNPDVPPERCPGCGALVHMPCVLCRTRRYVAEQRWKREQEAHKGAGRRRVA